MAKQIFETREGLKKLQDELAFRKGPERNRIKEAIAVAKGFGDLSENSEYDEARDQQAKNEHRINELEEMLKNIVVIEENEASADKITLGKTVTVRNESNGKEYTYHMVGSTEADPFANRISNLSPIGVALMGARVGDRVTSTGTPKGAVGYTVLSIEKTV
jgi:transcription elongation factor GreA